MEHLGQFYISRFASRGSAFGRRLHLKERKAMMQLWADYLDKLKAGAEVIPLHCNAA